MSLLESKRRRASVAGVPTGNGRSQLLDDIEEFSRSGPVQSNEPAKPEFTREKMSFPDLSVPAAQRSAPASAATSARNAGATPTLEVPSNLGGPAADSLLARLKQKAQTVQQDAEQKDVADEVRAQRLSASLGSVFHYLDDLIKQLNIIKPEIPKEFVFPGNIAFTGMSWVEGAADFRMLPTATEDRLYDSITARFRISAPRKISVERDAIGVEPLRKLLHDYNIAYQVEEKQNTRKQVESASFTFPCEIKAGFIVRADYAAGNLLLRTRNIERFGMMEFRLQPDDLNQETLDELTKLFLGETSRFLQMYRRTA
jgi:hypothetical protein